MLPDGPGGPSHVLLRQQFIQADKAGEDTWLRVVGIQQILSVSDQIWTQEVGIPVHGHS